MGGFFYGVGLARYLVLLANPQPLPQAGVIKNSDCPLPNYQGAKSQEKNLPGGLSAGTCLGGLLFIVKFNGACLRPPISRPRTQNCGLQVKYIDDASQMASFTLKKSLIPDPIIRTTPLNYHEKQKWS